MTPNDAAIQKHSVLIAGHPTSITLERAFWEQLKLEAMQREISLNQLIAQIDETRTGNLSSAIRVFVLNTLVLRRQN